MSLRLYLPQLQDGPPCRENTDQSGQEDREAADGLLPLSSHQHRMEKPSEGR